MFLIFIIVFDLIMALCMFLMGFYFYRSKGKALTDFVNDLSKKDTTD